MKASERPINYERPQDQYSEFEKAIVEYFDMVTDQYNQLYRAANISTGHLWDLYLNNLPEAGRFVYDCRECRKFIENYGDLVFIRDDGSIGSALWTGYVPVFFNKSMRAMSEYVERTTVVSDIFVSDTKTLGTPMSNGWPHLHAVLPQAMVNNNRVKNSYQIMAEKREERQMLLRALQEYPIDIAEQAIALLQTNTMYRSNTVLGITEWFLNLHKTLDNVNAARKNNLIWKAVGEAPTGYCHIKSSMIGTLLDDIKAGYSTRVIMAKFEEKMNPQNYMRSQSAPTAAAIEQAEKLVEKLGIADSLRRRYARFDEVINECFWMPSEDVIDLPSTSKARGVFANVTPKEKLNATPANTNLDLPATTMTWAKFSRTILPTADKLEVKIENPNRFMALVTEAVGKSEPILQWDNPFSWYYHGGIDGEMKRRVEAAGGRYENCEIRCSLMWDSYTDLDLHCDTPRHGHIFYRNKRFGTGYLDVDANGGRPTTTSPVENIRWTDRAPEGLYRFWVHNYEGRNRRNNPYTVELEVGGKVYSCEGSVDMTMDESLAFEFDYYNGKIENLKTGNPVSSYTSSTMWNLPVNEFVKVNGILKSPNMWSKINEEHGDNQHTFFILDGCRDDSEGKGRGFFNEILKPELREIRKTLEVYSANTPIEYAGEADACGVGFTADGEWILTLKVTSAGNSRVIKIDRFD